MPLLITRRAVDPLFHNHLLTSPLLSLVKFTAKGDGVVLPDRPYCLYAEIPVQIDMAGKRYMGIGFMGRTHPEPLIVPGQILFQKDIGFLFGLDAS